MFDTTIFCTFVFSGLGLKPDKSIKTVVGGGAPGSVVQGARTAVMVGGAPDSAPGVDLDRVAASMSAASDAVSLAGSSSGGPQSGPGTRQLRSLAGAITGAAANFKSKLASAVTGAGVGARSSPSPPDPARTKVREVPIRLEGGGPPPVFNGEKSPHVIPLTVPGAEYGGSKDNLLQKQKKCFFIFFKGQILNFVHS